MVQPTGNSAAAVVELPVGSEAASEYGELMRDERERGILGR
jgi:hypothetical protein